MTRDGRMLGQGRRRRWAEKLRSHMWIWSFYKKRSWFSFNALIRKNTQNPAQMRYTYIAGQPHLRIAPRAPRYIFPDLRKGWSSRASHPTEFYSKIQRSLASVKSFTKLILPYHLSSELLAHCINVRRLTAYISS